MGCCGWKQPVLFSETQHRTLPLPLAFEAHAAERIRKENPLINGPEEDVPEAFEVPVHGSFGELFFAMTSSHELINKRTGRMKSRRPWDVLVILVEGCSVVAEGVLMDGKANEIRPKALRQSRS